MLQGSLHRGSPPDKLRGQEAETLLLVPGDILMKNNVYQGKRKVKDWWSKTEYVVVHQVADGIPAYEVKDEVGNIKTVHHN